MKAIIIVCFIYCSQAFALDAVVTVLETPLLKYRSYQAPVVQYFRKGDVVKVHPSLNNSTDYDHLAPTPEKLQEIRDELNQSAEWKQDPLFSGEENSATLEDEFIPTLDRQGNKAYLIRDHLYFYFTNKKEFTQKNLTHDPTDYRLEEPLPKKFPLYTPSGYRGQVTLGLTQPYYESYPYLSSIKQKGYTSPFDLNIALLRQAPDDKFDRFYLGGVLNLRSFSNSYTLFNGVSAKEQGIRLGLGPFISYDAYKAVKNRLNLYGSITLNFFNQINVLQESGSIEEQRNYRTLNFSPRLGFQYHRKQVLEDVDFVLGTSLEFEPATTYWSNSAANKAGWWQDRGNDKFRTRASFSLAGYLGFQTAY